MVSGKITQYSNGFQYVDGILQFVPTPEGYYDFTQQRYVYNLKDHLGNNRVSFYHNPTTQQLEILNEIEGRDSRIPLGKLKKNNEQSHYYPFGMEQENPRFAKNNGEYKYKYQAQERQDELGLNWDSFKWRNYDYALGRFMSVDPLAEDYSYQSPYNFSENRVIDSRELEGLERVWVANALHKDFDKVYEIQRQTSGEKEFRNKLKSQNNYNVLYAPVGEKDFANGRTFEINDFKEWRSDIITYGLKLKEELYNKISENDKKDIIIITAGIGKVRDVYIDGKLLKSAEDFLFKITSTWNHEEVAHALKMLKVDSENAKDHLEYYNEYRTFSPSAEDVLKLDKYKGRKARKNFEEIKEIIKKEKFEE